MGVGQVCNLQLARKVCLHPLVVARLVYLIHWDLLYLGQVGRRVEQALDHPIEFLQRAILWELVLQTWAVEDLMDRPLVVIQHLPLGIIPCCNLLIYQHLHQQPVPQDHLVQVLKSSAVKSLYFMHYDNTESCL